MNTANPPAVLMPQEAARLRELEEVIAEGLSSFLKTGLAFAEVRFHRLHRATHERFEDYCRDRWALSMSRCNQIINTVQVVQNITGAFPEDATLLEETNEHTLRPLSRLEPELQTATWELIRQIEERPRGTTIEEVVTTIRNAISDGWQERESSAGIFAQSTNGNGSVPQKTTKDRRLATRQSDQLGNLCRWAGQITNWDPEAIAMADDQLCLKRRLKAARQLRTFCEALIAALETRLSTASV